MNLFFFLFSLTHLSLLHGKIQLNKLSFPLAINIYLIKNNQEYPSFSDYDPLPHGLSQILPKYSPSPSSLIEFSYQYSVKYLTEDDYFLQYQSLILKSPQIINQTYYLSGEMIEMYLSQIIKSLPEPDDNFGVASFNSLPIFIILPTRKLPSHKLFTNSKLLCSQTYTSGSLFVDLSASLCDYSHLIGEFNHHHSGRATYTVFHDLTSTPPLPPTSSSTDPKNPSNVFLTATLVQIIASAIKSFSLLNEDLKPRLSFSAQRIVSPIVFLKSRDVELKKKEGKSQPGLSINELKTLQNWIQSLLLPSQSISLLTSTHYMEDHPQLTIAMASASRWSVISSSSTSSSSSSSSSTSELAQPPGQPPEQGQGQHIRIPYIDSRSLLSELSQIGDNLCRRLLVDAGHGLEDDTLLQIETLFQTIEMKGEKLTNEEKITPDWIRQSSQTDDYDTSPHGPPRQRTQIIPVFVISDLESTGFELMESDLNESSVSASKGIFPLFEDGTSATSLESVALVLHSRETSLTVYSKSKYGGLRSEINLSDASLSIAEILSTLITGIKPPFEVKSNGHRDLTWTAGTHPFSPYGSITSSFINEKYQGYSEVYRTSSMRGIILTRAQDIIQEYLQIIHSAEEFSHDVSRLYHLLIRPSMKLLSTSITNRNSYSVTHFINPLSSSVKADFLDAIFSSLAFLQYIEITQKIPNSDLYLIPPEQRHMLQEMKTIISSVMDEILSLYQAMQHTSSPSSSSSSSLSMLLDVIKKCEENLSVLRWNYYTSENRFKQHLDMCHLDPSPAFTNTARARANASSVFGSNRYFLIGFGLLAMGGIVFGLKFIQNRIERNIKKSK